MKKMMHVGLMMGALLFNFKVMAFRDVTLSPYQQALNGLKKGLPSEAIHYIDRQAQCNHWAGEDAYNRARKQEIESAMFKLRCGQLDEDRQAILKKYPHHLSIQKAFLRAKNL